MRRTIWIAGVILAISVFLGEAQAQSVDCGEAPPLSDQTMSGQLSGRAQALSRYLGTGELSGQIQRQRTEALTRYPDAERTRANATLEYQVCVMLQQDRRMSTQEKIRTLIEIQREFRRPVVQNYRVIVRADQRWIDNTRLGRVDGNSSEISLKISGNTIFTSPLNQPTRSESITLPEGEHEFEFVAELEVNDGLIGVRDRCLGIIRVSSSMTVRPFVSFHRVSFDTGAFDRCELRPIN